MFGKLLKAAVGIVTLPVDIAADFLTLGGAINEKPEPYTSAKLKRIYRDIDEASE